MKCFRFLKCCAYVVCALVGLAPVQAQDVRATILGRVTDPTGAAVPGANVEVLNLANSVRTARTTNNAGNYEIPFLDPGQYSLTIELTGFKKYQREGISLRVNDKITLEVANPFYPLLPGTGLSGATVARSQLLLPYPQFTGVTMDPPIGFTWYHSLQARVERRFGDGFTIQGNYTWSKMMQATEFLNASRPRRRTSSPPTTGRSCSP